MLTREQVKELFLIYHGLQEWAPINTHLYFNSAPMWAIDLLGRILEREKLEKNDAN